MQNSEQFAPCSLGEKAALSAIDRSEANEVYHFAACTATISWALGDVFSWKQIESQVNLS